MNFGEILRNALIREKKTQAWLARKLGVTPGTITGYLNRTPSIKIIKKINEVLPLPEAASLLRPGEQTKNLGAICPEVLNAMEEITSDFVALIQAFGESDAPTRQAVLTLLKSRKEKK